MATAGPGAIRAFLATETIGADPDVPKPRLFPLLLITAFLSLQVWARYRWDFLADKDWQWLHILLGWGTVAAILGAFHGRQALRRMFTRRTVTVLAVAFTVLCIFWYTGRSDSFRRFFSDFRASPDTLAVIAPFIWFSLNATFWRLLVPFALGRALLGLSPRALGLPLRPATTPGQTDPAGLPPAVRRAIPWLYFLLFLGVLPFVVLVANTPTFLAKYPLSRDMVGSDGSMLASHFIAFEIFYLFVFVSGESFWRGFLAFGLEKDMGFHGIVFMVVPYVTSHFGKPLAETLGAIMAGLILGFLALKHRSVWLGIALHYGIALSMDLLAVYHHGYTFR